MAKEKKLTHSIINPAEREREEIIKANQTMQKAWALIYSEDPEERQRRLENSDASYSPIERDE